MKIWLSPGERVHGRADYLRQAAGAFRQERHGGLQHCRGLQERQVSLFCSYACLLRSEVAFNIWQIFIIFFIMSLLNFC